MLEISLNLAPLVKTLPSPKDNNALFENVEVKKWPMNDFQDGYKNEEYIYLSKKLDHY